jgi:hypothetical protein
MTPQEEPMNGWDEGLIITILVIIITVVALFQKENIFNVLVTFFTSI